MANKCLLLILIPLTLLVTSCWWSNKRDPAPQYIISGSKWRQIKLRAYNQSYSGGIYHDTIYQKASFDSVDYAQFSNNGTCLIGSGSSYIFYPSGALGSPPGQGGFVSYSFSKKGAVYIINTGIAIQRDTAYLASDTLRIHGAFDCDQFYYVTDAYYTR